MALVNKRFPALALGMLLALGVSACGGDTPDVPTGSVSENPGDNNESTGGSGDTRAVPVFPEDDIDWDSLRYKVDFEKDEDTWAGYDVYRPNYSREQWEALDAEGKVSREDYEAGFLRFQACVEENGAKLNGVVMTGEEINATHSDYDDDIVMACYERHFMLVDGAWQVNRPPKDISYLIHNEIDCIAGHGTEPVIDHDDVTMEIGEPQSVQLSLLHQQTYETGIECHDW